MVSLANAPIAGELYANVAVLQQAVTNAQNLIASGACIQQCVTSVAIPGGSQDITLPYAFTQNQSTAIFNVFIAQMQAEIVVLTAQINGLT